MTAPKVHLTRRQVLAGASALPLFSILTHRADAAEFELKYATGQDPTHPVNLRAKEAIDRIREATSGRVNTKSYICANNRPSPRRVRSSTKLGGGWW